MSETAFVIGVLILIGIGIFHDGIRHAFDRWVDHRDHVAELKYQQAELIATRQRIADLVAGLEPEKRQNSTVDQ